MKTYLILIYFTTHFCFQLNATTWNVGPNKNYKRPSEVSGLVKDGDTVLIDPAIYPQDVCLWRAKKLLIKGTSQYAHLKSGGRAYGQKAIWVIQGDSTIIENIEFSECAVPDRNGAGIRLEATHLVVRNCYFHDNQEGILAGDNPDSDVIIEFCEFSGNGYGDGLSHNLYINHVRSLTFQFNYSHDSRVGHLLKSRAYKNMILYNLLNTGMDNGSYEIDLPNGGQSVVMGNTLIQGVNSQNSTLISYGKEGLSNPSPHELYLSHNTIVNKKANGTFVNLQNGTDKLVLLNNIFAGPGIPYNGSPIAVEDIGNLKNGNTTFFKFVDAQSNDFRLALGSPAIHYGVPVKNQFPALSPQFELYSLTNRKPRRQEYLPDAGAYERNELNPFVTPIKGIIGRDFIISLYPDLGTNEISDNHCLDKTNKKNTGTHFSICGYESMHQGVGVYCIDSGTVIALRDGISDDGPSKDSSEQLGNYLVIGHAGGWSSIYGKLKQNSIKVKAGDKIQAGDPIALVGCSGDCEDPHLYFELKLDNTKLVDPHDGPCGNLFSFWENPVPYDSAFRVWKSGLTSGPTSIHDLRRNQEQKSEFDLTRDSIVVYWNLIHGLRKGDECKIRWFKENGDLAGEETYLIDRNLWNNYQIKGTKLALLGPCQKCKLEYIVNNDRKDEISFRINGVSSDFNPYNANKLIYQKGNHILNTSGRSFDYSIWSTLGQFISAGSIQNDESIDLNFLQKGIYYFAINSNQKLLETLKLIIE